MIHYSKVITGPTELPVTIEEIRAQLNIDGTDQDDFLIQKATAATGMCERYAGLSFVTQTRRVTLSTFTCKDVILPYGPVQAITSFTYVDADDVQQDVAEDSYTLDLNSDLAKVRVTESWPETNRVLNNVVIDYTTGQDVALVPIEAKEAVLRLTARLYEKRGDSSDGGLMSEEITDPLDLIKVYWYA
jgi:uncharacterized phiE125 gp8 family phage protein